MADDTDLEQDKDVQKRRFADGPTPGAMLRQARQDKKLDTKEIAATMNVDPWMLDALEHDEYGALGAPVFAKGHLRKYAKALGLDEGDVMVAYYQRDGTREAPPLVAESILRVERNQGANLNWLAPAAGVLALAVIALVLFLYFQPNDSAESARAAAVVPTAEEIDTQADERTLSLPLSRTEPAAESAPATSSSAAPKPVESMPEPAVAPEPEPLSQPEPEPVRVASAPEPEPQSEPPTQTRATQRDQVAPELRGGLSTRLSSPDEVRVTLSFEGESWVEVYDANRAKLIYDMGESGTRRSVSGPGPLQVFLGKAVDVEVMVNGRPYAVPRVSRLGTARFYVDAKSL